MSAPKPERLLELFRRLTEAPAASSHDEAKELLACLVEEVEDEMTDIENDPDQWQTDGRMYPIREDNWRAERDGVIRGRSRAHNVYIARNGAIEIVEIGGRSIFSKPGKDGRKLDGSRA